MLINSATWSAPAGSVPTSGIGTEEPLRMLDGHNEVKKISAVFAPLRTFASSRVWKGRYCSFETPPIMEESRAPPRATMRTPSEVFMVERLPR